MPRKPSGPEDLARLDVFHHLFAAVCEEMGEALMRSSFSANIRERRDFSCALFGGEGRMIGQASHLPVHLGSTPMSVAAAIERVEMGPGDAVCLNDPYAGGTHLPDVTFVSPVFLSGGRRPDFYCANRAHHADVGGAAPGSMAPARDVHGEGLRIPPVRLVRGGRMERELLDLILANMRVPREREADLAAQWSTNRTGEARLREMAAEHGVDELARRARQLVDWTARLALELVRGLPAGSWEFRDLLEEPGHDLTLHLCLTREGDLLTFDFRGTDACPESPLNTTRAVTVSAVFYVLRTLLPPFTPTNDGILRPVRILTRPGSLLDARYPSGVAAGNVETSQRLVDLVLGALERALPGQLPAASAGTMSNLTFGLAAEGEGAGERPEVVHYETLAGGAGGGPRRAGAHAVQTHMTNTRNTPIEELETTSPVRIRALRVRRGSGGGGRHPGGDGLEKEVQFLRPAHVAFVAERHRHAPWGAAGGLSGSPGEAALRTAEGQRFVPLPGKFSREVPAGSVVRVRTPGGGGWGADPTTGPGPARESGRRGRVAPGARSGDR